MTKAFSYIRFSTPDQARGDSLRRQLEAARAWCADRGLELDDTLRDLGRSAYDGGHAQFGALRSFLDLVQRGDIERGSYLIVESLDRLSREAVLDALPRLLDLIGAGITVVTLADGQEYSDGRLRTDPSPLIMSLLVMMRAHEESKTKGIRVGKAWAQKRVLAAERRQAQTAMCPGWMRLVGGPRTGHYELIPERAEIVRGIFADTVAGLGRRTIARRLNQAGVPTWGVGGKAGRHWHDSYVQKIIKNPAVFGRFEPLGELAGGPGSGTVIDGYYPAVVDESTFYAAQAASKARASAGRPSSGHRNILRGLAKCHACGSNLIISDKGARSAGPKLVCGSAHASAGCTDRTYYPYAKIEAGTIWAVAERAAELVAAAEDRTAAIRAERDAARARQAEATRRLENLVEAVAAGGGGTVMASQIARLQGEADEAGKRASDLDAEIKAAEAVPGSGGKDLMAVYRQFEGLSGDELQRARAGVAQRLRSLVERIDVGPEVATVVMTDGGTGTVARLLN